jgi:hypothetical protein
LQKVSWWLKERLWVDDIRLEPSWVLSDRWVIFEDQFPSSEPSATNQGEAFSTPEDTGDDRFWVHLWPPSHERLGDADDHEDGGTNGE